VSLTVLQATASADSATALTSKKIFVFIGDNATTSGVCVKH